MLGALVIDEALSFFGWLVNVLVYGYFGLVLLATGWFALKTSLLSLIFVLRSSACRGGLEQRFQEGSFATRCCMGVSSTLMLVQRMWHEGLFPTTIRLENIMLAT